MYVTSQKLGSVKARTNAAELVALFCLDKGVMGGAGTYGPFAGGLDELFIPFVCQYCCTVSQLCDLF